MGKNSRNLALMLAFFVGVNQSDAATIVSSYPVTADGSSFSFSDVAWESFGFKTGPVDAYRLDAVTMRLSGHGAGEVHVSIFDTVTRSRACGWSQAGGTTYCNYLAPGTSVGSLGSLPVQAKSDYKFRPVADLTLLPDTLYWVVFKGSRGASFKYFERPASDIPYTGDPGYGFSPWQGLYTSETGAKPFDFAKSPGFDQWIAPGVTQPSVLGQDWMYHSGLNIYSVEGTRIAVAVPEPSTAALFLAGGLVVALRRRALPRRLR